MRDENDRQWRERVHEHIPTPWPITETCKRHGPWLRRNLSEQDCPHCLDDYTPLNRPLPPIRMD